MPLKQRVPKLKGFNNPFRVEYYAVNLDVIDALNLDEVNPAVLVQRSAAHKGTLIKVLGRGKITKAVKVSAHAVSKTAEQAIVAAGGSVTIVAMPHKGPRPAAKGSQFTNR
jgi:large subunit ribosomal protein L15